MKPVFSLGGEPPAPRRKVDWATIAALLATGLVVGVALYRLQEAGAISEETFLATAVFVAASASGILIAMETARRAHRDAAPGFEEVPPPLDVCTILPPDWNWIADTPVAEPQKKRPDSHAARSKSRTGRQHRNGRGRSLR